MTKRFALPLAMLAIASQSPAALAAKNPNDPYESFNRPMFWINDKLDTYLIKPVATFYNTIMPKPLNQGIHNAFNNINTLPTIANDFLQFNIYQGVNDSWRFVINSTIGIGGLFDMATRMGLPAYNNDFGLTLATWGFKQSNYLVLPFFGPYTVRDVFSLPVDYYAFSIYPYIEPDGARYGVVTLGVIDRRASLLQYQSVMEETAIDKYSFMRDAYMQNRAYQIEKNKHLGFEGRQTAQKPVEALSSAEIAALNASAPIRADANEPGMVSNGTPVQGGQNKQ